MKYIQTLKYYYTLLWENPEDRAKYDYEAHVLMINKINNYYKNTFNNKLNILDIGCGKHYPHSLLFSLDGHQVTGIDMSYILREPSINNYIKSFKSNGFIETARYLQLDIMNKRKQYFKAIESYKKVSIPRQLDITFIEDDAEKLEKIADSSYDLVVSKDLFEHLNNPEKAFQRIHEVLKPGGICLQIIHLFPSISGGHNPLWKNFNKYEPWDHLRDEKFSLPFASLNKLTAADYQKSFRKIFKDPFFEYHSSTHISTNTNIEELLTQEILDEIESNHPTLTKEDLLHEKLLVIARRE